MGSKIGMESEIMTGEIESTRMPCFFILTRSVTVAVLIFMFVSGFSIVSVSADNHGYCFSHDYDDDGRRYCNNFQTIENIRQKHIWFRKFCGDFREYPDNICETIIYYRSGENYFSSMVRACLYDEENNRSLFFTSNNIEFDGEKRKDASFLNVVPYKGTCGTNAEFYNNFLKEKILISPKINFPIYLDIRSRAVGEMPR